MKEQLSTDPLYIRKSFTDDFDIIPVDPEEFQLFFDTNNNENKLNNTISTNANELILEYRKSITKMNNNVSDQIDISKLKIVENTTPLDTSLPDSTLSNIVEGYNYQTKKTLKFVLPKTKPVQPIKKKVAVLSLFGRLWNRLDKLITPTTLDWCKGIEPKLIIKQDEEILSVDDDDGELEWITQNNILKKSLFTESVLKT